MGMDMTETTRTQEEILARYNQKRSEDFLGFEVGEYALALTRENLAPLMKEDSPLEADAGPQGSQVRR